MTTNKNSIVGNWETGTLSYNFFNDGTYRYYNSRSGMETNARYSTEGGILTYHFSDGAISKSEIMLEGNVLMHTPIYPNRGSTIYLTRGMEGKEELLSKLLIIKSIASTEDDFLRIGSYFAMMNGYKNTAELLRECEESAAQALLRNRF